MGCLTGRGWFGKGRGCALDEGGNERIDAESSSCIYIWKIFTDGAGRLWLKAVGTIRRNLWCLCHLRCEGGFVSFEGDGKAHVGS